MPDLDSIPTLPYLSGRCQRFSNVGAHSPIARILGRMRSGLGIRSGLKGIVSDAPRRSAPPGALGESSRFGAGDWVRVLGEDAIRATLDERSRLRGLEFGAQQWQSCGLAFRVSKVVRRIIDDGGTLRTVSRTVLLDDVHCGGEQEDVGCGRLCPMMFRDEWLEPASFSDKEDPGRGERATANEPDPTLGFARPKPAAEIRRTLDFLGRRDNLLFMPEMARYAGQRFRVFRRLDRLWELERWVEVPSPLYILDEMRCTGDVLGADGPCDRGCHLLWHQDWLDFE
jgi:hypothetical protein